MSDAPLSPIDRLLATDCTLPAGTPIPSWSTRGTKSPQRADVTCKPRPRYPNLCSPQASDPAWRWGLVTQHIELTQVQALHAFRNLDHLIRSAWQWHQDHDAGGDESPFTLIAQAYALQLENISLKTLVEGLLLCNRSNGEIADVVEIDPDVIGVYHDLFFDVRGRSQSWLMAKLLSGHPVPDLDPKDTAGLMRQVALGFGWTVFKILFVSSGLPTADDILLVAKAIGANVLPQLHRASCAQGANLVQVVQVLTSICQASATAEQASGQSDDMGGVIMKFLTTLPLSVADPTDPANLTLPARELRAHEIVVRPN